MSLRKRVDHMAVLSQSLDEFKLKKGGERQKPTHTSFGKANNFGSYHIPDDKHKGFMNLYTKAMKQKNARNICLTIRHSDLEHKQLLVDIDCRYNVPISPDMLEDIEKLTEEDIARNLSYNQIRDFVQAVEFIVRTYFNVESTQNESFDGHAYVYMRDNPYIKKKDEDVIEIADGVHIVFPGIVGTASDLLFLRHCFLEHPACVSVLTGMQTVNPPGDIFDESVIDRNGWFAFGSGKEGKEPYSLHKVYMCDTEHDGVVGTVTDVPIVDITDDVSVKFADNVLINDPRNPAFRTKNITLVEHYKEDMEKFLSGNRKMKKATSNEGTVQEGTDDELYAYFTTMKYSNPTIKQSFIESLVKCLAVKRADSYSTWFEVGAALKNVDASLFSLWVEFSKKSAKFDENDMRYGTDNSPAWIRKWNEFRQGDGYLNIGSLRKWAQEDNPDEYAKIAIQFTPELNRLIKNACTKSGHYEVAQVLRYMMGEGIVFSPTNTTNSNGGTFWHYRAEHHRWIPMSGGCTLMNFMSEDMRSAFGMYKQKFSQESITNCNGESNAQKMADEHNKAITRMMSNLSDNGYKKKIIAEFTNMITMDESVTTFEVKLDNIASIFCCTNGVLDMKGTIVNGKFKVIFRPGQPTDYCSLTCGIEYKPYDPNDPYVQKVEAFFKQILPVPAVRLWVLTYLASALNGDKTDQIFPIFSGSGGNGKTLLANLIRNTFGHLMRTVPAKMFTEPQGDTAKASPQLAMLKGCRFVYCEEPPQDEKLNTATIKDYTGNGTVYARQLHKDPIQFKVKAKYALACNDRPRIDEDDGGTWRRMKCVDFPSRFRHRTDPDFDEDDPHCFERDDNLPVEIDTTHAKEWAEALLSILVKYYEEEYATHGLVEPPEVQRFTREYRAQCDMYMQFVNAHITRGKPDDLLDMTEAYGVFTEFYTEQYGGGGGGKIMTPKKSEVVRRILRCLKVTHSVGKSKIRGWMLNTGGLDDDDEDIMCEM